MSEDRAAPGPSRLLIETVIEASKRPRTETWEAGARRIRALLAPSKGPRRPS